MTQLNLPALQADSVLGFLATLGIVRLLTEEVGVPCRLGWPGGPYSGAMLDAPFDDLDALASVLTDVVAAMVAGGRLLPGVDGFPPLDDGLRELRRVFYGPRRCL